MDDGKKPSPRLQVDSVVVHAGYDRNQVYGALSPPIWMASTYANENGTQLGSYYYSRWNNPSREAFENAIKAVEEASHAIAFSSGTAACVAVLSLLRPGDCMACLNDLYAGTVVSMEARVAKYGIEYREFSDVAGLREILSDWVGRPRVLVWIETPSNPTLRVVDVRGAVAAAAICDALVVVDNTFMTGASQRPLALGAHVSVQSVSKGVSGHSDLVMGVVCTRNAEGPGGLDITAEMRTAQVADGASPSPFDCFLALRGLRTLALRAKRQADNAMQIALALDEHPAIRGVLYPGLPAHPGHSVAKLQSNGFGPVVSFYVRGGRTAAFKFMAACKLVTSAVSLGGVESVVEHPASMTHRMLDPEKRHALGITDELLRFSAGIEAAIDLIRDIIQALEKTVHESSSTACDAA